MGINQTEMSYDSNAKDWIATTELAVCVTGSMIWQVRIKILAEDHLKPINATFEFEAK